MRKQIIILILFPLFFIMQTYAQSKKQEKYFIKGTVKGIDSGTIRMLSEDGNSTLDSSTIMEGKFIMKGIISLPERRVFVISPGTWSFKAFVEDATLMLTIDTAGAQHYGKTGSGNSWALIWEIEENGSKLSDVYTRYKNETNQKYYIHILSSLNEKLDTVEDDEAASVGRKSDSVTKLLIETQKRWIENYIQQYPESIAGVYIYNEFCQSSPDLPLSYIQSIIDKFTGIAKSSVYYFQLTKKAANLKNTQINNMAPDFTLLKRDKTQFTLSTIRGGYAMIDFWASWCGPCRKSIPNWKKIYSKYHQKGFNIVSVSNDRSWNDWIKALDKEQMPWIQVIDKFPNKNASAQVAELYEAERLPFYVLLDKEGKVILASDDEETITKKIKEIF